MAGGRNWTKEDDELLLSIKDHPSSIYIQNKLNRTWTAIRHRLSRLKYERKINDKDRFISQIQYTDTCWIWLGNKFIKSGYGRFNANKKFWLAHKFMWHIIENKSIPNGYMLCHSCDNRLCVNPGHLFVGTHQDNMNDMTLKHRQFIPNGIKNHRAKLSEEKVLSIRKEYNNGASLGQLSEAYNVHKTTIHDIIKRKKWKHI